MNSTQSTAKNEPVTRIEFRPITEADLELLYRIYESTRLEELAPSGWSQQEIESFLRMQFGLQHVQYMENYKNNGTFEIILVNGLPAGRVYVHRKSNDLRVVDLALLPEFRRKGIGRKILTDLLNEAQQKKIPISLHVEQNNPALSLYEQLEFEVKDHVGVYYYMVRYPKD